jgi:hypothetical protein
MLKQHPTQAAKVVMVVIRHAQCSGSRMSSGVAADVVGRPVLKTPADAGVPSASQSLRI